MTIGSFCCLALPACLWAQSSVHAEHPRPAYIRAARMLDVLRGELVLSPLIRIQKGRITELRLNAREQIPGVLELGDVTLLPGLIDVHTHLTATLDRGWEDLPVHEIPAQAALVAAANAKKTLAAGFTTVRDLGNLGGFPDVALSWAIDRGLVEGPHVVPAGHAVGMTGGHCDMTGFAPGILELGPRQGIADGVDQILSAVRYQAKHGAKVIKVCATSGVLSSGPTLGAQQYSQTELQALVEEAGRHGLRVAAHAHGSEGIADAVRAGVHSIEHGSVLTGDLVRLMKERGVYLVMNPYLMESKDVSDFRPLTRRKHEEAKRLSEASLQLAMKAGVKMAFGTDAGSIPHGDNARQFSSFVRRGVPAIEAIRMATTHAADLLGLTDRGVLAEGKLADLVATPGSPLEDVSVLERVKFVMRGGTVYKHER